MSTAAIINTGNCNFQSVFYACKTVGFRPRLLNHYTEEKFSAIIVPGVGDFGFAMKKLRENRLDEFIKENVKKNVPSLFICLGMQLLFQKSKENTSTNGLGIFEGEVVKFNTNKIICPVVGWNDIKVLKKNKSYSFDDTKNNFYFIHSYYVLPKDNSIIHSTAKIKNFEYCSSIFKNKLFGVQFHPEKSHTSGLKIYKQLKENIHE